jgi:hypothetical protein
VGYGQTGWDYSNKAYCCEDAVVGAQDDSAAMCGRAGGFANMGRGSSRGRCKSESRRDGDGRSVYRCSATATVDCR